MIIFVYKVGNRNQDPRWAFISPDNPQILVFSKPLEELIREIQTINAQEKPSPKNKTTKITFLERSRIDWKPNCLPELQIAPTEAEIQRFWELLCSQV